jgi:hypothetical protein
MNESPSARLDRLVSALEELGAQDNCLATHASWEEAIRVQARFAEIVAVICPLADSLSREGFLSEATRRRVQTVMQRQHRTNELVREKTEQARARLEESGAATSRISMIRPVYGSHRGYAAAPSVLNSRG